MKAKVIFASMALAAMSLTSCGGSGSTSIPEPTEPKTFSDSVAMAQGIVTGTQLLEQYMAIPDSLRTLDREKYLAGMQYILSADTTQAYQQGMAMALQMLTGLQQAREAGIDMDPQILLAYFAESFRADSVDHSKVEELSPTLGIIMSQYGEKMQEYQYTQQAKMQVELQKMFTRNVAEGKAFIDTQKSVDPDLKTTASGLVYKVTKQGTGPVAKAGETVNVAYTGKLVNGNTFDSTEGRFAPFEINDNIIPGFKEALTTFPRGSKAYIIIPQEIAYADQGSQGIQPGSTIIFEIEIAE
ncbi:MAG: hypothetical protein HDS07_09070 [Bacteroides sp.]|nr:hypothetical protein [Bacteroides sp.]